MSFSRTVGARGIKRKAAEVLMGVVEVGKAEEGHPRDSGVSAFGKGLVPV